MALQILKTIVRLRNPSGQLMNGLRVEEAKSTALELFHRAMTDDGLLRD